MTSAGRPDEALGVGHLGVPALHRVHRAVAVVLALGAHDAARVGADDVAHAGVEQDLGHRDARRAEPGDQHAQVAQLAAGQLARVHAARRARRSPCRAGRRGRRGCRQVAVQALLDLEAARRRDVLEVDAAEAGGQARDGLDDLVGVLRVQADRERVDAGELLEEHRLALHHRHRRRRADVAEAEHRGAVGDDGHRVALDRVLEGLVRILGDRLADARDARACRPSTGRRACAAGACCAARSCRRRAAGRCGRSCR